MQHRYFRDRTKVSLLGFGCMRLPTNEAGKINRVEAKQMIDEAFAGGINYFDTAYGYHNGESESFLGEALSDYKREQYFLADKMPMWVLQTAEDAPKVFEEQLQKCRTDYFDFYLLHSVTEGNFKKALDFKTIAYLMEEKAAGRIKHLGFSFHDEYEIFEKVVRAFPWDFCQIQFNYLDENYQAGLKGLRFAAEQGLDVIVMEPLKGGKLADLPQDMLERLATENPKKQAVDWAFSYVASQPEVKLILSGMSTPQQLRENLALFDQMKPLNEPEYAALREAKDILVKHQRNLCTNCRYCMPCPFGVDIPNNFLTWNEQALFGNYEGTVVPYFSSEWDSARADRCTECGQCETLCPQHISIRADLAAMHREFSELRERRERTHHGKTTNLY